MAIDLDDRLRRALELAHARGRSVATAEVCSALGPRANGLAVADASTAEVGLVLAQAVDPTGRIDASETLPVDLPLIVVLSDEGRLVGACPTGDARTILAVVFRRGVLRLESGRFVLIEVEEDVSARDVRAEVAIPMYADATLVAFR